jgi:hypothetical protein
MSSRLRITLIIVAVAAISFLRVGWVVATQTPNDSLDPKDALKVIFAVATLSKSGQQTGLSTTRIASMVPRIHSTLVDDETVKYNGYTLTVRYSRTAPGVFTAALVPTDKCSPAWFTDQNGVVYQAKAVDCKN